MNTKEDIWAQVQLKLLEGFEVSVVRYASFNRDVCRHLICFFRHTGNEKSILVRRVSNRNAMFVSAWFKDCEGVKPSRRMNEAVSLVFRYGSGPTWTTYRIEDIDDSNVLP